jgi:hypothetical protein
MRWLCTVAALLMAFLLAWSPAFAATYGNTKVNGKATITRPNNTTGYTGASGGQLYCATTCVAIQIQLEGAIPNATGVANSIKVESSTTGATAPSFIIYLFKGSPTLTGLSDQSTYIGPYAADWTSGNYLGAFTCATLTKTNDGTAQWAGECTGSNPNTANVVNFQTVSGQTYIYAVVEVTATYTPIANEVLTILFGGLLDQGGWLLERDLERGWRDMRPSNDNAPAFLAKVG